MGKEMPWHRTGGAYLNLRGAGDRVIYLRTAFGVLTMVLWIGVDDTDSLKGMCTTYLATELIRELTEEHDLIGYPRLVRLNPNIPWKTRGNGAIAPAVGRGCGRPFRI